MNIKKGECETCLFSDLDMFDIPCRYCIIETNSEWQPKDDQINSKTDR